jgi:hypothetical protein
MWWWLTARGRAEYKAAQKAEWISRAKAAGFDNAQAEFLFKICKEQPSRMSASDVSVYGGAASFGG